MVREVIKKIAAPSTDADLETSDDVCLASELLFCLFMFHLAPSLHLSCSLREIICFV